jgi:bidirectional [NiFe] hydrogenase diaphorase subunit
MAIELLLVERNHICAVCVSNGHCELQSHGVLAGRHQRALPYNYPRLPVDMSHPRFVLDHNRCILCTRCVRVCAEVEGAHVWEVVARHPLPHRQRPEPEVGEASNCTAAASACRPARPALWPKRARRWRR